MKKEYNQILALPMARMLIYLTVFIVGSVLHDLLSRLVGVSTWSNSSILLGLSTLAVFVFVGAVFICERHVMSRVTSAATLLVLGVIALKLGHTAIPDLYLFVIAFCVAFVGARAVFHRKLASSRSTILYSLAIAFVALVLTMLFIYGVTVADRIAAQ